MMIFKKKDNFYCDNIREFDIPKKLIEITINTNEYNCLILYGAGGLGKSLLVKMEAKKHLKKDQYNYFDGHITPLKLYSILFENKDRKLLILDDIEAIFKSDTSVSILKSALWGEQKRIVQYNTSKNLDIPNSFEFKANLILCLNRLPKIDISIQALLSRCLVYELKLSFESKIKIITEILNVRHDLNLHKKNLIIDIIKNNVNISHDLNFRLLKKLIAFIKHDETNALDLFLSILEKNEDKEIIIELMTKDIKVNSQIKEFIEMTGKTRRTFFRLKKDILNERGLNEK